MSGALKMRVTPTAALAPCSTGADDGGLIEAALRLAADGHGDRHIARVLSQTRHWARGIIAQHEQQKAASEGASVSLVLIDFRRGCLPALSRSASTRAWAAHITACWRASVKAIFEVGRLLTTAKEALPHGEFLTMVESSLPFGASTAQRLMAIAADTRLSNAAHVQHLPLSWGTLYELTKLSDPQFEAGIRDGVIRPDMERKHVIKGARAVMAGRVEPDDSLGFFPTPPWATRALMQRVLPTLDVHDLGKVLEPACGEGHMAEVLREYCPTVLASDVFDYGYGDVRDFLTTEAPPGCDWAVSNPPFADDAKFGDKATAFVLRALNTVRVGVAMFVRSQWAVEGINRFKRIFRDRPPTLVAFFVERVNLCKGRWEPDGDTATAYCWLVWVQGMAPRAPMWIPPGCREALTQSDDVDRFTTHPVKAARCAPSSSASSSSIRCAGGAHAP